MGILCHTKVAADVILKGVGGFCQSKIKGARFSLKCPLTGEIELF
jgi:hypothetical protein